MQNLHTLWMMCLLERPPHQMEIFLIFEWDFNGNWERGKRQNHIVIKSKAIDLFWLCSLALVCWLAFICSLDFHSSTVGEKKSAEFHHGTVDSTLNFFFCRESEPDDICITSRQFVRVILMIREKRKGERNFLIHSEWLQAQWREKQLII